MKNKAVTYILVSAVILLAILHRYFSIIAINTFLFADNVLNVSQGIHPFILWAILGLLVGATYGTFVAWKKYTLDFKFTLLPIVFLAQLSFLLYIYNDPLKNGVSKGIPNPALIPLNPQVQSDTTVAIKSISNDKGQNSISHPSQVINPDSAQSPKNKKPVATMMELKTYTGSIGKLDVIYTIKWFSDGTLDGTYYYTARTGHTFTLKGKELDEGKIQLTEYTDGKISAHCILKLDNVCFSGKLNNTDGRHFNMKMCEQVPTLPVPQLKYSSSAENYKIPSVPQLKQYLVGKTLCGIACNGSDEISAFVTNKPEVRQEQIVVRVSFIIKDLDKGESENCSGDYIFLKEDGASKFSKFISN